MLNTKSVQKGNIIVVVLIVLASLILGATGTYWYINTRKAPTTKPVSTPQSDTTTWKTYPGDKTLGLPYSFKYPSDIEITEAQTFVYLKSGSSTLYHSFFGKAKDIDSLMSDYQPFGAPKVTFPSKTAITFGDLSGYKALNSDGSSVYYFLEKKPFNTILMFSHEVSDKIAEGLFNKIVSTISINSSLSTEPEP